MIKRHKAFKISVVIPPLYHTDELHAQFFILVKRHDVTAFFATFSALVWNFSNLADTIICRLEIKKIFQ